MIQFEKKKKQKKQTPRKGGKKAREEQTLGSRGADGILIRRVGSAQARGFCHRSALPRPRIRFGSSIWRRSVAGSSRRPPPLPLPFLSIRLRNTKHSAARQPSAAPADAAGTRRQVVLAGPPPTSDADIGL